MTDRTIRARLRAASRTAAQWATETTVPLAGEILIETDTGLMKIGNGTDQYKNLPYHVGLTLTNDDIDTATADTTA